MSVMLVIIVLMMIWQQREIRQMRGDITQMRGDITSSHEQAC